MTHKERDERAAQIWGGLECVYYADMDDRKGRSRMAFSGGMRASVWQGKPWGEESASQQEKEFSSWRGHHKPHKAHPVGPAEPEKHSSMGNGCRTRGKTQGEQTPSSIAV